jgi:Holliday junction resolvase RusA-like endonuclease
MVQKRDVTPVKGPYACAMIFPRALKGDLDNRAKCVLDWMVSRELTSDDKYLMDLHLVRDNTPSGYVIVQVRGVDDAP